MVTRRAQQHTDDASLQDKGRGRGRGRGRAPGRGRGKVGTTEADQGDKGEDTEKPPASETPGAGTKPVPKRAKRPQTNSEGDKEKTKEKDASKKSRKAEETQEDGNKLPAPRTSRMKRPASAKPAKAKENADVDTHQPAAKRHVSKKANMEHPTQDNAKTEAKTWAGRWIPEDPVGLSKYRAIRKVFEEALASKLKRQSAMQSPFYKLCGQAFREAKLVDGHAKYEDYVAVAELQVEPFLQDESVRACAPVNTWLLLFFFLGLDFGHRCFFWDPIRT